MTFPKDNLRLHLTFYDELRNVHVMGSVSRMGSNICNMGSAHGGEALQDLLEKVGIDHFLSWSGDIFPGPIQITAYRMNPKAIVETVEKNFRREDQIQEKILSGVKLTEEERSFEAPLTLWVCSSLVEAEEGLRRVAEWFKAAALAKSATAASS